MDSFRSPSRSDDSQPLFSSPALPSELLWYIIHHCSYPTTLIVCSSRLEFLTALARDAKRSQQVDGGESEEQQQVEEERGERKDTSPQPDHAISTETQEHQEKAQESSSKHPRPSQQRQAAIAQSTSEEPITTTEARPVPGPVPGPSTFQLLASPLLYQIAISRHIRTVFVPTVSHLRAFLSVFNTNNTNNTNNNSNNKIPAPPPSPSSSYGLMGPGPGPGQTGGIDSSSSPEKQQLLLVYGFLALHRDSSEWSVQGLNNTLSVLLEAGRRAGLRVVVVEPVVEYYGESVKKGMMDDLLGEKMPVVSGSALKAAEGHIERTVGGGGLMGRMVDVRRVLGRWFRFGVGEWEKNRQRG